MFLSSVDRMWVSSLIISLSTTLTIYNVALESDLLTSSSSIHFWNAITIVSLLRFFSRVISQTRLHLIIWVVQTWSLFAIDRSNVGCNLSGGTWIREYSVLVDVGHKFCRLQGPILISNDPTDIELDSFICCLLWRVLILQDIEPNGELDHLWYMILSISAWRQ